MTQKVSSNVHEQWQIQGQGKGKVAPPTTLWLCCTCAASSELTVSSMWAPTGTPPKQWGLSSPGDWCRHWPEPLLLQGSRAQGWMQLLFAIPSLPTEFGNKGRREWVSVLASWALKPHKSRSSSLTPHWELMCSTAKTCAWKGNGNKGAAVLPPPGPPRTWTSIQWSSLSMCLPSNSCVVPFRHVFTILAESGP